MEGRKKKEELGANMNLLLEDHIGPVVPDPIDLPRNTGAVTSVFCRAT